MTPPSWWRKRSAAARPNSPGMMTAKARALGMMHTNYHNASGLPDDAPDHHRARRVHSGPRPAGPLPAIFPLFFAARLRLSRPPHAQSQSSARPRRRRRRHEDRLYPRFRLQHRHRRAPPRPPSRRGGVRRPQRARARRPCDRASSTSTSRWPPPSAPRPSWSRAREHAVAHARTAAEKAATKEHTAQIVSGAPLPPRPPLAAPSAPSPGSTAPIKPIPVRTVAVQQPVRMHTASLAPPTSNSRASSARRRLPPIRPRSPPSRCATRRAKTVVHVPANQVASAGAGGPVPRSAERRNSPPSRAAAG